MRRFYLAHFRDARSGDFGEAPEIRVVVAPDLFDAKRQFLEWYLDQGEYQDKENLTFWFREEKGLE